MIKMKEPNGYWNYDTCFEEAKKYSTRTELHDKNIVVYKMACKNKWIDDYTWFTSKRKPNGYWNDYEKCYEEAKKYNSKSEFQYGNGNAYQWAKKNNWLDDYYWFDGGRVKKGTWTYENVFQIAKHCKDRMDFAVNYSGAYDAAITNGWIDDWEWLARTIKPSGYWNYERCLEESKKFKSRSDFALGNSSAYSVASKNGWLDSFQWLIDERLDVIDGKIDLVYSYEFENENAVYVGRTLMKRVKDRDKEHLFSLDSVSSFAKEIGVSVPEMKILETNLTIKESTKKEGEWVEKYKKEGWIILNKAKTGGLGGLGARYSKFTYEVCFDIAKSYSTRNDFRKGSPSAYMAALKNKWLDDYEWFVSKTKPRNYWNNYENCYEVAKKCSSRADFKRKSVQAYRVALHNGWIDDYKWFEKPKPTNLKWNYEACLNEAKKYTSRGQFADNAPCAYRNAKNNGWLEEYTWFSTPKTVKKWNCKTCYEEAKRYDSKIDFRKNANGAYQIACRNGWINDYTWFNTNDNQLSLFE